jgi:hypothetical protein
MLPCACCQRVGYAATSNCRTPSTTCAFPSLAASRLIWGRAREDSHQRYSTVAPDGSTPSTSVSANLLGRLRNNPRVVNLEGHNVATLDRALAPDVVGLITMDLSYLAVSAALPQLADLDLETHADLVVLVKPTFELHAATLARSDEDVSRAVEHAERAMISLDWHVHGRCDAPATGRRGAREVFVHGRRERQA